MSTVGFRLQHLQVLGVPSFLTYTQAMSSAMCGVVSVLCIKCVVLQLSQHANASKGPSQANCTLCSFATAHKLMTR